MNKKSQLPSFFVIGTQKSGTTTLHDWLSSEPGICLPAQKETHFFSMVDIFNQGLNWYLDQFLMKESVNERIVGEVDPDYMFYDDAPSRISAMIVRPRFIVILRNPIERAYSHYLMSYRRGIETKPFPEALLSEPQRRSMCDENYYPHFSYMGRGEYSAQISRYRAVFPKSDFLFIKYDELFGENSGNDIYREICRFIGLSSPAQSFDVSRKSNVASRARSKKLADFIYGKSLIKSAVGMMIPSKSLKLRIAVFIDKLNRVNLTTMPEDWRRQVPVEILDAANREIVRLEETTGLKFQDWIQKNLKMITGKAV